MFKYALVCVGTYLRYYAVFFHMTKISPHQLKGVVHIRQRRTRTPGAKTENQEPVSLNALLMRPGAQYTTVRFDRSQDFFEKNLPPCVQKELRGEAYARDSKE